MFDTNGVRSLFDISNVERTDSYKFSHWKQYPKGTEVVYSYLESRGGLFAETVFFGLNYYLKQYLSRPMTMADVDRAEARVTKHMGPGIFNRKGFERIVNVHGGYWPVRIKAVPEGTVVPTRNVLMTIENTDPECPWATNIIETMMLKVWYPITVATLSREIKKLILKYLEETGDPAGVDFKLHDFGYRGVSSEESAAIGGAAHLVNFKGSDTFLALDMIEMFYGEDMAGFSIPAAEHSTITSWGRENEYEAYLNMVNQFGDGALYAVVSDSYNIYDACSTLWGEMLKQKVLDKPGFLVVRPDSGTPHKVVREVVEILAEKFGYVVNEKGYKVLNHVRVIQGDGINLEEIGRILEALKVRGWSTDNIAFGMGGALLQQMNRDTQRFAFKASSMTQNGRMKDVYKEPVTDNDKRSKRGRLKLIKKDGFLETVPASTPGHDILQVVWDTGTLIVDPLFSDIRDRAALVSNVVSEFV
jgi:nicotinamide phosphoribosyltransferase